MSILTRPQIEAIYNNVNTSKKSGLGRAGFQGSWERDSEGQWWLPCWPECNLLRQEDLRKKVVDKQKVIRLPGKAPSSVCAQFSSPLAAAELTSSHRSPSFDLLLHLLPYCCCCCWSVRRGGRSSSCSSDPPTTLPSHPTSRAPHVWYVNSISWESQLPHLQGTHPSHFLSLYNK